MIRLSSAVVVLTLALASAGGMFAYLKSRHTGPVLTNVETQNLFADDALQPTAELWLPLSSASDTFQASGSLATLRVNEQVFITLPSGNSYPLRLDRRSTELDVEQLFATVDPNGRPGFALLTIGAKRMYGTLNTPEGVYELLGTQTNFRLKRSVDIDIDRRKGPDYIVRERSEEEIVRPENNVGPQLP